MSRFSDFFPGSSGGGSTGQVTVGGITYFGARTHPAEVPVSVNQMPPATRVPPGNSTLDASIPNYKEVTTNITAGTTSIFNRTSASGIALTGIAIYLPTTSGTSNGTVVLNPVVDGTTYSIDLGAMTSFLSPLIWYGNVFEQSESFSTAGNVGGFPIGDAMRPSLYGNDTIPQNSYTPTTYSVFSPYTAVRIGLPWLYAASTLDFQVTVTGGLNFSSLACWIEL